MFADSNTELSSLYLFIYTLTLFICTLQNAHYQTYFSLPQNPFHRKPTLQTTAYHYYLAYVKLSTTNMHSQTNNISTSQPTSFIRNLIIFQVS